MRKMLIDLPSYLEAERLGFVREGHRRQTRKHPLLPDGRYSGDYLYGMLREEYGKIRDQTSS